MDDGARDAGTGTRDLLMAALLGGALVAAGGAVAIAAAGAARLPPQAAVAPTPLKDLAKEAGIQPPTALAHLRRLEEDGKVRRVATPEGPRYAVLPFLRCEWIDPGHGIQAAWTSGTPVDWRFPLVSRVPDGAAQEFLLRWLDVAQARGLLPPARSRHEPQKPAPPALRVVVYGSCARGDAHPRSDLDVLLLGDLPKKETKALVDLAHEVALEASRSPDIRVLDDQGWEAATAAFRAEVERDGKTVFSNLPDVGFVERLGAASHG